MEGDDTPSVSFPDAGVSVDHDAINSASDGDATDTSEQMAQQFSRLSSGAAPTTDEATSTAANSGVISSIPAPRSPVQARLHESYRSDRRYLREMVRADADLRGERVDVILALKSSLDTSSARINAQNAVRRRRVEQLAEQDARSHETLLSQGLNPYEVTRRREITQQAARERSAIERNIRDKQAKVLQHLEVERVQQQRREKIAAENRAYEKKYQREMGRTAVEERVQAYLVARTGKETLDPTGKAVRIYPSQETPLKDNSFGLGKSLVHTPEQWKRMIEKVRNKTALHRETGPSSRLLPRQLSVSNDPDEVEREVHQAHSLPALRAPSPSVPASLVTASIASGPCPGEDLRGLNHVLVSHSSDSLPVKLPPLGSSQPSNQRQQSPDLTNPLGVLKKQQSRSVLEQKMLDNARKRQRETVYANKQVVWGREFEGDAFRADPPALWFKDFDVDTPLTLSLTLTNVSNTFNQFKLLDVEDEGVRELFEIKYERPGRMSAGMTCALTITFTGDRVEDIDTWLPVAAPTGVTRVPIKCTCKKAVPVLSASRVRFEDVVAGESQTIALTLENRGALPFTFRVTKTPPTREDETTEVEAPSEHVDSGSNYDDQTQSEPGMSAEESPQEADASLMDRVNNDDSPEPPTDPSSSGASDTGDDLNHACQPSDGLPQSPQPSLPNEAVSDLSEEELRLVKHAQSLTRYEPLGFDTPITFKESGVVPPYSSVPVTFTFNPAAPMRIDSLQLSLDFYTKRRGASSSADSQDVGSTPRSVTDINGEAPDHISSMVVTVSAHSTDVPIFVADELINLQSCAYGKLYRTQILIGNRGKIALKMQIKPPKALIDVVEFHPSEGYVQAGTSAAAVAMKADGVGGDSSFTIVQVKFRPTTEMWKRIERLGLGSQALGMLAVPIRVLVPDQRVPVFVMLAARVTPSNLVLSPGSLSFGDCCVGHSISRSLTITNCARVPQRIAAVTRPPELVVLNDDRDADGCADGGDLAGAGVVLLPLESRRFRVVYEPTSTLPLVSSARPPATTVKTTSTGMIKPTIPPPPPTPLLVIQSATFNRSYSLVCSGLGVKSPLAFSQTVVALGATQVGQLQLASIFCVNQSDQTQQFELRLPTEASKGPTSLLRITPTVATLAPRQRVRIELEFCACDDVFELADRPFGVEEVTKSNEEVQQADGDSNGVNEDSGSTPSPPMASVDAPSVRVSMSRTDTIDPGTTRELSTLGGDGAFGGFKLPKSVSAPSWASGIAAEPRSCHVTWTILCFRRPDLAGSDGKKTPRSAQSDAASLPIQSLTVQSTVLAAPRVRISAESLNFGQVALGQATRLALKLVNDGDRDLQLRARALHAMGAFRVINSTQRLLHRDGGVLELHVEFAPQSPVEFEDELELLDVDARAKCPVLRVPLRGRGVNPSLVIEPHDGALDFKGVLARSRTVQELTLTNASGFPLKFSIAPWSDGGSAGQLGVSSVSGLPVFSFQPSEGTIPSQANLSVKVAFHPDHSRPDHYAQRFRIHVPNESERHLLSLSGRCWENQLYVFAPGGHAVADDAVIPPPTVSLAIEDLFDLPPSVSIASLVKSALPPWMALAKPPTTITITFGDDPSSNGHTQSFFVGSTLPLTTTASDSDAAKAAAPAYSFELAVDGGSPHAKLFALEPLKGSLSPGQQVAVSASFHPPMQLKDASAALTALLPSASGTSRPEIQVSQWVELRVTCTLRGGAMWRQTAAGTTAAASMSAPPAAGKAAPQGGEAGDTRVVALVLRAKLRV